MWMCVGMPHPSYRINLNSLKFYSKQDLLDLCAVKPWPCRGCFFEFAPSMYMKIQKEEELHFACEVVSRFHAETCELNANVQNMDFDSGFKENTSCQKETTCLSDANDCRELI